MAGEKRFAEFSEPAGSGLPTLRPFMIGSTLAAGLVATWAAAAGGEVRQLVKLDAVYSATLLGIPIGEVSWIVELHDNRFAAAANGSTVGLLRVFANGHGIANAEGVVTAREPVASNFTVRYTSGASFDEIRIAFSGGKAKEHLAPPPKPDPSLVPLTDSYRTGVVDPMTALLIHVPGSGDMTTPAACARKIAVFDGHMRYDLRLAYKRLEQVRAEPGYQGPAVVCAVYFSPLAGYDPGRTGIKYLVAQRGIEIWLVPLAGTRLLVPFRASVPTPLGLGVLQARRFVLAHQSGRSNAAGTN